MLAPFLLFLHILSQTAPPAQVAIDLQARLLIAIEGGQSAEVVRLLDAGADMNGAGPNGERPLTAAVYGAMYTKRADIVSLLLKRGADVNTRNRVGSTALMILGGFSGFYQDTRLRDRILRMLLPRNPSVTILDSYGQTPLHNAFNASIAEYMIARGAVLEAKDDHGITPLSFSSEDVSRVLLSHGANVNAKDRKGMTPLMHAADRGWSHKAKLLIDHGADVNAQDARGNTPLLWASVPFHGFQEAAPPANASVVKLLLKNGADVNLVNDAGEAALTHAASQYSRAVGEWFFFQKKADIPRSRANWRRAQQDGLAKGHAQVIRLLLHHGADPNKPVEHGATLLQWLVPSHDLDLIRLVLAKGADATGLTREGQSILTLAKDDMDLLDLLRRHGARAKN